MRLSGTKTASVHQYRGLGNRLYDLAGSRPSLDLNFADQKSLVDAASGQNLVTFTRASSGTYVDSQGVIRTATTNLLLRSEEFQTTWTTTRANISGDAAVAPNGSVTADKLVEDTTATSTHVVAQTGINYVSGLSYTFSCYAKEAGRQSVRLSFPAAAFTTNIFGHFNLANGSVVSSSTGVVSTITAVGNGWYRCSATATATASTSAGVTVFIGETSNSTNTSFSGDGTSGIYLWGAQLEQSSSVGEYIPTGATINSAPRFDHNPTTGESLGLLVEANLRLAALFRRQNQPEVAVPLLVEVVKSMTPASDPGRRAYQQLLELGFVTTPYGAPAPSGSAGSGS